MVGAEQVARAARFHAVHDVRDALADRVAVVGLQETHNQAADKGQPIDILLGGDNAVVIALACRKLPLHQRKKGIAWGVVGAIGLRIILIFFALQLLMLPYLKIVGALLLLWIGVKLLQPEEEGGHVGIQGSASLLGAIRTIIVADAVMSLDNVIAVAGAAKGHLGLVIAGIAISIPIIVWGSRLVLKLMDL